MKLAKIENGVLVSTWSDDPHLTEMMMADGFKPYNESVQKPSVSGLQALKMVYQEQEDCIAGQFEVEENSPEKVRAEISRLKDQLSSTDYRLVKSYEYYIAGKPLPYDTEGLTSERQTIRDRINELETLVDVPPAAEG